MLYTDKLTRLFTLPDTPFTGYAPETVTALETRLQITVPVALKNFYLHLGNCAPMCQSHNRLLKPDTAVGFSPDNYLVIYEENQVVAYWGIRSEDLSLDNPPVYGNYSPALADSEWLPDAANLEDFLLVMSISNGVLGGLAHTANSFEPLKPETLAFIEANWQEEPSTSLMPQRIFTRQFDDVICIPVDEAGQSTGILVGSNHRERFNDLLQLDVYWYFSSDEDE